MTFTVYTALSEFSSHVSFLDARHAAFRAASKVQKSNATNEVHARVISFFVSSKSPWNGVTAWVRSPCEALGSQSPSGRPEAHRGKAFSTSPRAARQSVWSPHSLAGLQILINLCIEHLLPSKVTLEK